MLKNILDAFLNSSGSIVRGITSTKVITIAAQTLSNPNSTEAAKTMAGSILGQITKGGK